MRLKPLLVTLALGVTALPIALALVVAAFVRGGVEEGPVNRFVFSTLELHKAVRAGVGGGLEAVPGYEAPAWMELLVTDAEGRIVVSTSPNAPVGGLVDAALLEAFAAPSSAAPAGGADSGPSFYDDSVELDGKALGRSYILVKSFDQRVASGSGRSLLNAAIFAGLGLLAVLAGIVVAARLGGSVLKLQRAAGRIADGDLETEVSARGAREIVDLAAAMESMRQHLREDLARRARFLAAVSHDLRTPLTSIVGYLEALEDGLASDPATMERYVGIMREKARALESRIAGLIEFARMETGEWRMRFEIVELLAFLEKLAREWREDAALLGLRFECDLGQVADAGAMADAGLLTRALENVVSNALHHARPGGLVRLDARRGAAALEIAIEDDGDGIGAEETERVFEPFYRGKGASEGEGLGLGLFIARSIIRGHGWEIRVERAGLRGSAERSGCRFVVSIPLP